LRDKARATPPDAAKCFCPAGVASLFDFGCVVPRSQIAADMLRRHVLPKPKIDSHAAPPIYEMVSSAKACTNEADSI